MANNTPDELVAMAAAATAHATLAAALTPNASRGTSSSMQAASSEREQHLLEAGRILGQVDENMFLWGLMPSADEAD